MKNKIIKHFNENNVSKVQLLCRCGIKFIKTISVINYHTKLGRKEFFCGVGCANEAKKKTEKILLNKSNRIPKNQPSPQEYVDSKELKPYPNLPDKPKVGRRDTTIESSWTYRQI